MAVTAHWIDTALTNGPRGPQYVLELRSELIAFHLLPGRHTAEHLARAFLASLDRVHVIHKVRHNFAKLDLYLQNVDWLGDNGQCIFQCCYDAYSRERATKA
jgi:hypothetical protein